MGHYLNIIVPNAILTATVFQERYGELVQHEHGDCISVCALQKSFETSNPQIRAFDSMMEIYLSHYHVPVGAVRVSNAQDRQQARGSFICQLLVVSPCVLNLGACVE